MNKNQTRTYRSGTLPLSSLKLVLLNARKGLPPRISRRDGNEELAASLIEKLKLQFTKQGHPVHPPGSRNAGS